MRNATLTICFVALGYAANAQKFTLLPQVGFENSKTKISFNDLRTFAPAGVKFSPQAGLRLNYSSKQGHGFFLGAASSRSIVSFSFIDPENAISNFIATTGNMQLRLEGGYLFNSKPISLGSNQSSVKKPSAGKATKESCGSYSSQSSCMKNYYSSQTCSGKTSKAKQAEISKKENSWVRIQPSVGMAFIPAIKTDVITKTQNGQTTYQYNAGNMKTAIIAGAGFEFGKGNTRQFTVSVNYFNGIGNLNEQTITSSSGTKPVTTILQSSVSGWNMKLGIPFTLWSKKPTTKAVTEKKTEYKSKCGQYKMIYRYRCNGIRTI